MPVRTSRTNENAAVSIDYSICTNCGLCADVCKVMTLRLTDKKVSIFDDSKFGCFGCGQCAAVCPLDCITVSGRELSIKDFDPLPSRNELSTYTSLYNLMYSRRSIRDYKDKEITSDDLNKILSAASTAPMGIPPSDVEVVIFNGKEKVNEFAWDMIDFLAGTNKMLSFYTSPFLSPFVKKADREILKSFIIPLIDFLVSKKNDGEDFLFYSAPLAIYFYASPYADTADPYIAATYAMLAAESLGIGSCMIGTVNPFLEHGGNKIKDKYGINRNGKKGIVVIFGYPKYKYHKGIKRTFAKIILN